MTTIHTGDRTTGCKECAKNGYLTEILESHDWAGDAEQIYTDALEAWVANSPTCYKWENHEKWVSDFEESFQGWWETRQEFADQLADDTVTYDFPELAQTYFDYEKFARDIFYGDYWESDRKIFPPLSLCLCLSFLPH